jgi:UDP-glucose 4-epimerase
LRYFHVYGSRQDCSSYGGVVSIFNDNLKKDKPLIIYGDGTQERSFTHVDDVVKANLFAMSNEVTNGQVYNCASGISVTINQLADAMIKLYGKKEYPVIYADWLPGDIKRFEIENTKIKRDMGIIFTIDLKEGLKKTI